MLIIIFNLFGLMRVGTILKEQTYTTCSTGKTSDMYSFSYEAGSLQRPSKTCLLILSLPFPCYTESPLNLP